MAKQNSSPQVCREPFDRGARLCSICRLVPAAPGLRKCSRLVAESPAMRALMLRAAPIASSDATVIVLGESGTGKEVLARTLHANSPRSASPFVAVNVAALPAELLESELFGHAKGAFTGATAPTPGLFEAAGGGTLLLDEIAEMPLPLQTKLLRVLQEGEVRRVGDTRAQAVDVRVISATNQDLAGAVEERRFRQDLYYRLKVFTLHVPPLRERAEDILSLARMFLEEERHPTGRFSTAAERALLACPWPGNVRELANAVRHGATLSGGRDVGLEHLPDDVIHPRKVRPAGSPLRTLAEVEREHVLAVLSACGGNQVDAARVLGIGRTTLWRKLRGFESGTTGSTG
ncbi:MAG: sigma-54-dependent Fis family transcriptional regulator [Planctomycetes bacterium]|nr:sigma-54-dependent Fis family transcriptional regulator [Planctomycetota bacterium]